MFRGQVLGLRLVFVPKPKSKQELEEILQPKKVKEKNQEYSMKGDTNSKYIFTSYDDEDDIGESGQDDATSKEKVEE